MAGPSIRCVLAVGMQRRAIGRGGTCCRDSVRRSCTRLEPRRSQDLQEMDGCRSSCGSPPRLPERFPWRHPANPRESRPKRFHHHGRCTRSAVTFRWRRSVDRVELAIRSWPARRPVKRWEGDEQNAMGIHGRRPPARGPDDGRLDRWRSPPRHSYRPRRPVASADTPEALRRRPYAWRSSAPVRLPTARNPGGRRQSLVRSGQAVCRSAPG